MEAYYRIFRLGIDDQLSPFVSIKEGQSAVELLTVPFPSLEFIFPVNLSLFETTGYHRVHSAMIGRIQVKPIKTYLQADYEAFCFFLHPVTFFEATGISAANFSDPEVMEAFLNPLFQKLEEVPKPESENLLQLVWEKCLRCRKSRSCYRVVDRFLQEVHALPNSRIQEVADTISFSGKHLRSTFRSICGISPKQYLQLLQLQGVLRDMVSSKHYSLTEIALRNGFYDQSHFNKVFRKYAGLTPRQFRQGYIPYSKKYKNTIVL
jgi:AraC-like DNA-binding protein